MHGVSVPLRPKIGNLGSASPTRPGPLWCILPLPLCYTQKSGKQAFLAPTVRSGPSHFKTWAVSTESPSRGFSIDFGGWGITKHRKQDGQPTKSSLKSLTSEKNVIRDQRRMLSRTGHEFQGEQIQISNDKYAAFCFKITLPPTIVALEGFANLPSVSLWYKTMQYDSIRYSSIQHVFGTSWYWCCVNSALFSHSGFFWQGHVV